MKAILIKIKDFFCKPRIILILHSEGDFGSGTAFLLLDDASGIDEGATLQIGSKLTVVCTNTNVIEVKPNECNSR